MLIETLESRLLWSASTPISPPPTPSVASADASMAYIRSAMDAPNRQFVIFDDLSSPDNHFLEWARLQAANDATVDGSWTTGVHSGATCIRCTFQRIDAPAVNPFDGFVFQTGKLVGTDTAPSFNFGDISNAGTDLSGATRLVFWARGETGHERVTFFMGGAGYLNGGVGKPDKKNFPYHDSTPADRISVQLTKKWKQYSISVRGRNLSYVLNGFGWDTTSRSGAPPVVFYLDDIRYDLKPAQIEARLNIPRFIQSYRTLPQESDPGPAGDFDLRFRNVAFTYDNALAILALLATHSADDQQRATLIGDAFVYAAQHDPVFTDGRVRSIYSSGELVLPNGWIPNGELGSISAPGFWDNTHQTFVNLWYQSDDPAAIDTGNNAWAMIALLTLYGRTQNSDFLTEARRLGDFIETFRNNSGSYQGFLGGLAPNGTPRPYASTEHNIDIYAAFTAMYNLTHEPAWLDGANHALEFVDAMWDPSIGMFRTGTTDPNTLNTASDAIPLDVQAWSVLAIPNILAEHPMFLATAGATHKVTIPGGQTGYDFNNDLDGIWFEGTGQLATAYELSGDPQAAAPILSQLQAAQQNATFSSDGGLAAASQDGLTTGFGFEYMRRIHIAATAWNVFAELGVNPYYE